MLNAADAAAEAEDELLLGYICAQAAVPSLLLTARGSCPLRDVRHHCPLEVPSPGRGRRWAGPRGGYARMAETAPPSDAAGLMELSAAPGYNIGMGHGMG